MGSEPTAAGGGRKEASEWPRSIKSRIGISPKILSGTATGTPRVLSAKEGRLLYAQSTISFCNRKNNRSFFAFLARLIGGMAAEILFSVGI